MSRDTITILVIGGLAVLVSAAVGFVVGWPEAGVVLAGIVLMAAPAWFPAPLVRAVATAYLAAVAYIVGHATSGVAVAVVSAVVVGLACWYVLPHRARKRVCFMIPSLVLLIFVTTMLMYMAPGNPFASEKQTTQQALKAKEKKFKVEASAYEYFKTYMDGLIREGSMGLAVKVEGRTVNQLLLPALPVSMTLGLLALIIAVALGLVLGIRAGIRPNSIADYTSMGMAMIGISLPNFVIGAAFLIVFALKFGWLPVAGWGGYRHLVLPAMTLALPYAAYIARLARSGTIEVMQQDFVRTARAKGLSERAVIFKHALKGAILPVVSFLGPAAAGIFTGSFVVETLFGIPGMGMWFVNAAIGRDYSVVLGAAIIYFTLITLFNLLVDFAYAWLDPRVREDL